MTLLHAAGQTAVALVRASAPESVTIARPVVLALLVAAAVLWAAADGWRRVADPARTWFVAALITGPAAGVLGLVAQAVFVDATGIEALGTALVGGAAFTALLVLVPAMAGLGGGGLLDAAPSLGTGPGVAGEPAQRERVPVDPEADDHPGRDRR